MPSLAARRFPVRIVRRNTVQNEQPYRLMVEAMNEGALILTKDGTIVYANERFAEMVGVWLEDILGGQLRTFLSGSDWGKLPLLLAEGSQGRLGDEITLRNQRGIPTHAYLSLVPLKNHRDVRICAVVTDLTPVIAAHRARLQLGMIVESSDDAIFMVGPRTIILSWNDAAQRIFGYKAREVVGRHVDMLSGGKPRLESAVLAAERAGFRPRQFEAVLKGKDGRRVDGEVTISAASGKTVVIVRDVTKTHEKTAHLRQLTGKLLITEDEERRSIARQLHEGTAQNLAALCIDLAMISATLPLDEVNRGRMEEVAALAKRCTDEVRNLAYIMHPPALEEVGLSAALAAYLENFKRRCGVDVKLELSPDLGTLSRVVDGAVFRIVQEALNNVYRHSETTTAKVTVLRHPSDVSVEIVDRGKGMSSSSQTDAATRRHPNSSGLANMRERVELLGGRLEIRSSSKEGTSVKARIPIPPPRNLISSNNVPPGSTPAPASKDR